VSGWCSRSLIQVDCVVWSIIIAVMWGGIEKSEEADRFQEMKKWAGWEPALEVLVSLVEL
jgi:hypothetical protein